MTSSISPTMSYRITVILDPQPEGGYTVTCQELPELITQGDSIDEALENVKDAFSTTLELYEHLGRPLPDSIQIPDEKRLGLSVPVKDKKKSFFLEPFPFETLTPVKSEDTSFEHTPFWFQARFPSPKPRLHS